MRAAEAFIIERIYLILPTVKYILKFCVRLRKSRNKYLCKDGKKHLFRETKISFEVWKTLGLLFLKPLKIVNNGTVVEKQF